MFLRAAQRIYMLSVGMMVLGLVPPAANGADYCFQEASIRYQIPHELLEAISHHESKHNPKAINWNKNGSYDYGHMQINSIWYSSLGPEYWDALAEPCYNTMVGAWILSQCIQRHGYTWIAIGCYNAGSKPTRDHLRKEYAWKIHRALQKVQKTKRANFSTVITH